MFSQMFVCHSVHEGPHITITHDALDLTVQIQSSLQGTGSILRTGRWSLPPLYRAPPLVLVTSGGHDRRPDQTCPRKENPHWC